MATPTVVQRWAGCGTEGQLITVYKIRLANAILSGNCAMIMIGQYSGPDPTITNYTQRVKQAGTNNTIYIFDRNNITDSQQTITINWGSNANVDRVAACEFRNIDTSATPTDGTSGTTGANGTTMTTGSLTTAVDGDLILTFVVQDDTSTATSVAGEQTSWVPQASVTLLHADIARFHCGAYQIQATHGTNTLNVATQSGNGAGWISATVAYKNAAAGTAPAAGIHIDGVIHTNISGGWAATTAKQQVPNTGNLLVAGFATEPFASNPGISTISDTVGSTWNNAGGGPVGPSSQTGVTCDQWKAVNISASSSRVITWTYGNSVSGGEPSFIYDISSADAAPFDKRGTDWGTDTLTTALITHDSGSSGGSGTPLGTPAGTGELMIQVGATFDNSVATGVTAFTAASPGFLLTSSDTTPDIGTTPVDEADPAAVYYLPNANNPGNTTWTKKQAHALGDFAAIATLWKAAPAGGESSEQIAMRQSINLSIRAF